jgi:hypothetical protein
MMRRITCIYLWVIRIPEDDTELRAADIIIWGFAVGISLFEIERSVIDVITVRKHENAPSPVSPYVRRNEFLLCTERTKGNHQLQKQAHDSFVESPSTALYAM